jgi:spore germination cell wall hydrolase CwlJ-like protein
MEYEDGSRSLLSILLNVDRFSEIGDRLEYSNKINNYFSEKMNAYTFMMDMVSKTRDSLDELRKQREEELIEYDKKRAKFKNSIADMTELMKEAKEKADNANTFASELQTEIARMEAEERMLMIKNGYNQTASQNSITYTGNGTDYYYRTPFAYTEEELLLLAGIIEAEAGSSHYPGMVAVGSVVMNRIESPRYDNTIEGVIYAEGQFEPVRTGRLAVILARGPAVSCIGVAKEVLDGKRNVPYLAFKAAWYAEEHGIEGVNIGGNVFH